MIERVRAFIDKKNLIDRVDKILVAVSGGVDSMVLIHLLKELRFDVAVAHMNFQLRGQASNRDESFVKTWCESNDVVCYTEKVDTKAEASRHGESLQMAARKLRYAWFDRLSEKYSYQKIATAHHLNDSFETVLLNLVKGTGVKGLVGIPPINGKVIRPLLEISKEEILAYANDNGLKWREDRSNQDSKYQRNLIRNEVVSLLQKINPSLFETFKSTIERMQGVNDLIQNMVNQIRNDHLSTSGEVRLGMKWFDGSAGHLVILSELLRPYGVQYSLVRELGEGHPSGKTFLTPTHTILYDRDQLLFKTNENLEIEPIEILNAEGTFSWGNWKITVKKINTVDVEFDSGQTAYFNIDRIRFPIQVRSWKEGDWFIPLGMTGKKKISDFFIDNKIPLTLKNKIPIFESGSEIIWIGGYRMDDRYKVGEDSMEVVRVELEQI